MASNPSPPDPLYARLAARLPDDEARALLRAPLASVDAGGADAVRAEVRRRLQDILRDAG